MGYIWSQKIPFREKIMREEAGKLAKKDPFGGEKTKPRSAQGPILDKFELNPECQNGYFYWKCKSLFAWTS